MIDEVLKNVREAEAAADQIIENARLEAERIRLDADARARLTEETVKKEVRVEIAAKKAQAEANALADYKAEQAQCAKKVDALKEEKKNIVEQLADEMLRRLLDGSC